MTRVPLAVRGSKKTIGENLRHWRTLLNLTREQLADRAGVSVSTLVRLENGSGASLDNLLKVAHALKILDDITESTSPWTNETGQSLAGAELERRSSRR